MVGVRVRVRVRGVLGQECSWGEGDGGGWLGLG